MPDSSRNHSYPNGTSGELANQTPLSRRALRDAELAHHARASKPSRSAPSRPAKVVAPRVKAKRTALNLVVMAFAGGLIATMALPAYAYTPSTGQDQHAAASVVEGLKKTNAQTMTVAATAVDVTAKRDGYTATTEAELQKRAAAKAAELQKRAAAKAAEKKRKEAAVEFAAYQASYSGPSVQDMLAKPPNPNFSLSAVYGTAKQYVGVPYVYGGATPAGFDCSGFIMFVYAQYGINLPHGVGGEAAMGKQISQADAQPGDLVVFAGGGHDGFYAGNGNILDAPKPGGYVSVRPIWNESHYFVRIGI